MGDCSPLMFESDDETEFEEAKSCEDEHVLNGSDNKENCEIESKNHKRVERLNAILSGVPPPPAVTFPQYEVHEMLKLWNEGESLFNLPSNTGDTSAINEKGKELANSEWPVIPSYHGIDYNLSESSEKLAVLNLRYQERYVGSETSSCCNSFFSRSPLRTASAKKRARRHAWGHSPGRRLSHLARRRNTFSSVNLQQSSSRKGAVGLPNKKKMILVDKRKVDPRKRTKNSATKNSVTKNAPKNRKVLSQSMHYPKRALFQSPENDDKKEQSRVVIPRPRIPANLRDIQRSKRALFSDGNETSNHSIDKNLNEKICNKNEGGTSICNFNANGKRLRNEMSSDLVFKNKCNRALSFDEVNSSSCSPQVNQMPVLERNALSKLHKQKLLWAVSGALREMGIKMNHKCFQPCASELFNKCKTIWLRGYADKPKSVSTSDKMLELVKHHCSEIVDRVRTRFEETSKQSRIEDRLPPKLTAVEPIDSNQQSALEEKSPPKLMAIEQPDRLEQSVCDIPIVASGKSDATRSVLVKCDKENVMLSSSTKTKNASEQIEKHLDINNTNFVHSTNNKNLLKISQNDLTYCSDINMSSSLRNSIERVSTPNEKKGNINCNTTIESAKYCEIYVDKSPVLSTHNIRNSLRKTPRPFDVKTDLKFNDPISKNDGVNDNEFMDLYIEKFESPCKLNTLDKDVKNISSIECIVDVSKL